MFGFPYQFFQTRLWGTQPTHSSPATDTCMCVKHHEMQIPSQACSKSRSPWPAALSTFWLLVIPYDKIGPRWQAITDAVTLYVTKDMFPIYTVEKKGFSKMLQTMNHIRVPIYPLVIQPSTAKRPLGILVTRGGRRRRAGPRPKVPADTLVFPFI